MTDLRTGNPMPALRQARPGDWPAIRELLAESGLPVDDLGPNRLSDFLVAEDDGERIGLIGLDVFGKTGLLRSLVVVKRARGDGLGGKLVEAIEAVATAAGITDLWLLTIDADRFFKALGFEIVDRTIAPAAIKDTEEFGGLCPDTAHLMRKSIEQGI